MAEASSNLRCASMSLPSVRLPSPQRSSDAGARTSCCDRRTSHPHPAGVQALFPTPRVALPGSTVTSSPRAWTRASCTKCCSLSCPRRTLSCAVPAHSFRSSRGVGRRERFLGWCGRPDQTKHHGLSRHKKTREPPPSPIWHASAGTLSTASPCRSSCRSRSRSRRHP